MRLSTGFAAQAKGIGYVAKILTCSIYIGIVFLAALVTNDIDRANNGATANESFTVFVRDVVNNWSDSSNTPAFDEVPQVLEATSLNSSPSSPSPIHALVGKWSGPMKNSRGGLVRSSDLIIRKEVGDTFHGTWHSGWKIENGKRKGSLLTWEHKSIGDGCKSYNVRMLLGKEGDVASLKYDVKNSCNPKWNYHGKAVLLKEDSIQRLPQFKGRWSGTLVNTRGDAPGVSTVVIKTDRNGTISGHWHGGWRMELGRRDETSATWRHTEVAGGCRDYQARMVLNEEDPDRATLSFEASDRCREPEFYTGVIQLKRRK